MRHPFFEKHGAVVVREQFSILSIILYNFFSVSDFVLQFYYRVIYVNCVMYSVFERRITDGGCVKMKRAA